MKKTLTINLNNIVFHIDDDAYDMLQSYLADVEKHLSDDEKKEVMADIEARIAEIFSDSMKRNKTVINLEDVEEIINVLGKPNQFSSDEEDDANPKTNTQQSAGNGERRSSSRRFYRDPENAVLGGIASGIAAYFSWDVTWVRIGIILLSLLSIGHGILIYFIVWLIAPKAVTVAQRLEMQGEDVTVENIKSEINNVKNYVESDKFKQSASGFGEKFLEVIRTIIKVLAGFIGGIIGLIGIILAASLLFVLVTLLFVPGIIAGFSPEIAAEWTALSGDNGILMVISLLLVIGTPVFMIVYWSINLLGRKNYEHSLTTSLVALLLWTAGLFMLYSVGAKTFVKLIKSDREFNIRFDDDFGPSIDQIRTVEAFKGLDVSNNIEVEFVQDLVKQLVVSAPQEALSEVITEVVDGKLKIYTESFFVNYPIKVSIHNDSLTYIEGSGAARFKTQNIVNSPALTVKLSGASSADLDFNISGTSEFDLSGAAKADVNGNAGKTDIHASGASKFEGNEFKVFEAVADANGASKISIYATKRLDAEASGASDIDCEGNPTVVKRNESGGSSIRIK